MFLYIQYLFRKVNILRTKNHFMTIASDPRVISDRHYARSLSTNCPREPHNSPRFYRTFSTRIEAFQPEETPINPDKGTIKPEDPPQITIKTHKCQRCKFSTADWSSQ
jgi:hypothetical protein